MVEISPDFIANSRTIFLDAQPTLEDVRQKICGLEPSTRRRDALSAFEALRTLFKTDLAAMAATFPVLRRVFANKNAVQLGISQKRYANIRSLIFWSVRELGVPSPNLIKGPELTEEWKGLLSKAGNKNYRSSLKYLGRFCSAMQICPTNAGREALLGLFEALQGAGSVKSPHVILRQVTSYWNYYEKRIPEWPRVRLGTPFAKNRYLLSLSDLSPSLQKELLRWQLRRAGGDLLSLDEAVTTSRPETIQHQTKHVLRFLGLLVKNGLVNIREMKHLTDIVEPELVKAVITDLLNERRRSIGYAHSFTYVLLGIARHETTLSRKKIQQLERLSANLRSKLKKGMTTKNRTTLRQFDGPENVEMLMKFSTIERGYGAEEKKSYRQAKYYERALIADLLIYGALRMKNIVMLRIDQNMRKHGSAYILTYTADEMKTKRSHEIQLPDWITQHIDEYKALYRPILDGHQGPYLFPGKVADGHRHHSAIREEFKRHIYRETGLKVNPHFMRHLTSKLILDKDPGQLKTVSNRLGHSTTETAQTTYLETDSLSASRMANNFLSNLVPKVRK